MALIPQDPKQQRIAAVGGGLLAGFVLFYMYVHSPRTEEIGELEARLENLEGQNRRAQILATRGRRELEERLQAYERHIQRLEQLIPRDEELPELLNNMALEARRTGVELSLMRPETPRPGPFYTKLSYTMGVVGGYHAAARFLTSIASLPRIVTPVDVSVEPAGTAATRALGEGEEETLVEVRFRVETYILPQPVEAEGGTGGEGGTPTG